MSKTLVTGGTGFLGSHLVQLLLEQRERDIRVLATAAPPELVANGVELVEGSVTSAEVVARAVEGVDQIYHLAGRVSRDPLEQRGLFEVHVEGTRILCQAARRAGVRRLVLASSSGTIAVTEDGKEIPDESWPTPLELVARWPYYASKLYQEQVAERECREGPELVILNPSLLLGPGDSRLSSTRDILKFLARDIPAIPPGGLNFVDVRDVAAGFHEAMNRARAGERYLLGGPNWSFERFFARLERLSKVPAPRLRASANLLKWGSKAVDAVYRQLGKEPPIDPVSVEMSTYFWYLDSTKARREIGFVARDPAETLYDTVAYLKKHFLGDGIFR